MFEVNELWRNKKIKWHHTRKSPLSSSPQGRKKVQVWILYVVIYCAASFVSPHEKLSRKFIRKVVQVPVARWRAGFVINWVYENLLMKFYKKKILIKYIFCQQSVLISKEHCKKSTTKSIKIKLPTNLLPKYYKL